MKWLSPAFRPHPDIEALNDSGHKKFNGIDVKLGVAMSAMLRRYAQVVTKQPNFTLR